MSEKRETIADIIAEISNYRDPVVRERRLDVRLKAAYEREIEAARREPRTWGECVTEYQKRKEAGEYGPY